MMHCELTPQPLLCHPTRARSFALSLEVIAKYGICLMLCASASRHNKKEKRKSLVRVGFTTGCPLLFPRNLLTFVHATMITPAIYSLLLLILFTNQNNI